MWWAIGILLLWVVGNTILVLWIGARLSERQEESARRIDALVMARISEVL